MTEMCDDCADRDGELVPATEAVDDSSGWVCAHLCAACADRRRDYEPPDRDWEPAPGDDRERMAEIQRTLK